MSNLAKVLSDRGKYEEAEKMHRQELAVRERVLGKEHPDTLMAIYCLAHLLASQTNFVEADTLYERAIKGYHKALGPNHPTSVRCQQDYASMLEEMPASAESKGVLENSRS
jgi:tetratricopeptide (TPR) repeat protein